MRYFIWLVIALASPLVTTNGFYWPRLLISKYVRWLNPNSHARINPNIKCPACGNKKGTIRFLFGDDLKTLGVDLKDRPAMIGHRCELCKYFFLEPTVTEAKSLFLKDS